MTGYVVVLACRVVVAGVFAASLLSKVRGRTSYAEFVASVAAMRVLPRRLSRPVATVTIVGEGCATLLVALPLRTAGAGFVAAIGLLAAFTAGILLAIRHGNRAPCRCFGASSTPLGLSHVVRNLVLLAVCMIGLGTWMGVPDPALDTGGVVLGLGSGAVVALFVLRTDDIAALFGKPEAPAADTRRG